MPFGNGINSVQITTGNVRTTFDPFSALLPFNGLKNPLGTIFNDQGGLDGNSGTLAQLPAGTGAVYKYVLYKSTGNPALVAAPAIVYYTDNTGTIVTGKSSEAFPTAASGIAGFLMPNTTDLSALTATILNNGGLGSGVWICVGGLVKGAAAPAATAAGDIMVGATDFTLGRYTAFAAASLTAIRANTALAGAIADMFVYGLPEST